MIILGIDPGIAIVGYGIIGSEKGIHTVVDYGVIETPQSETTAVRLALLAESMEKIIKARRPDSVAIEELYFNNNQKTFIRVAEARGVLLHTAIKECGRLSEYTPLQVKQSVTGYGRADKPQMQQMVKLLLKLDAVPRPDDAADALAVALCHAQHCRSAEARAGYGRYC
ncbi:MAG: crossover junction endodeoxyribonuclease RuvC [Clostridiales bacterium]|jgi:crossover junction endodeoxyribonuclease RuvC|nr:crossover junction endodeoxyribonuclease RuvC [Clostridiales bacterium]